MSTAIPLLSVIALVAAVALCGVGIWAAIEMAKAARSTRQLTDDLDQRLVPLSEKLDVTVDAPIHLVSEVADRFRHGFRRRGSHARRAHPQPPSDEQEAEVVLLDAAAASDEEPADAAVGEPLVEGENRPSVIMAEPEMGSTIEPEPEAGELGPVNDHEPPEIEPLDDTTSSTDEPEEA